MMRRLAALFALFAVTWSIATAQTTGVHPISGRRFAEVMDASGASWLDRRERDVEEAPDDAHRHHRRQEGIQPSPTSAPAPAT